MRDQGLFAIDARIDGSDPIGHFYINIMNSQETHSQVPNSCDQVISPVVKYLDNITYQDSLALETGYDNKNVWLDWVRYTASTTDHVNCLACAKARPTLGTVPFKLNPHNNVGLLCALQLFTSLSIPINTTCHTLAYLFPPVKDSSTPPSILVYTGNSTCFSRKGAGVILGALPKGYCANIIDVSIDHFPYKMTWFLNQTVSRADLWWLCGDNKLRPLLPSKWSGTCTLGQLIMPFQIFPISGRNILASSQVDLGIHKRLKRSTPRGASDSGVYIDSIGVPWGVPDEFNPRNQIAAGFE